MRASADPVTMEVESLAVKRYAAAYMARASLSGMINSPAPLASRTRCWRDGGRT